MKPVTVTPSDAPPNDVFSAEVKHDAQETHVALRGELDLTGIERAQRALLSPDHDGQPVVVDFHELRFMDLSGLRLLLAARQRLGERLTLRGCSAQVHRLFELTATAEQLPIVD